jgi:chromosome segregation ATPase
MSNYEIVRLQQEINHIKWQKAENYKVESLETTVHNLENRITQIANEKAYLQERVECLERQIQIFILDKTE